MLKYTWYTRVVKLSDSKTKSCCEIVIFHNQNKITISSDNSVIQTLVMVVNKLVSEFNSRKFAFGSLYWSDLTFSFHFKCSCLFFNVEFLQKKKFQKKIKNFFQKSWNLNFRIKMKNVLESEFELTNWWTLTGIRRSVAPPVLSTRSR